jgi:peptidoglycan hydrolase CwlO-like protein
MTHPWLSALKSIPWSNVIEHAPKVLDKARNYMAAKDNEAPTPSDEKIPEGELEIQLSSALNSIKTLQADLKKLKGNVADLSAQQTALETEVKRLRSQVRFQKAILVLLVLMALAYYGASHFSSLLG